MPEIDRKWLRLQLFRSHWRHLAGWLVTCWIIVFWRLGYLPLFDPDEAHYAEITREMSAAHQWVVPLLEGKPYIDKPVLFHWLQGAAFWLLGGTEFAARLPSALSAIVLMALTAWVGTRFFGRRTGERAALLLATMPATFALSSVGIFDMLFSTCLFGALACLAVGTIETRPRLQDLGFVLLAAAVLTKGPVAVVLLTITAACCLLIPRTRAAIRSLPWLRGLAIVLIIGAPWFCWMWYRFGDQFVRLYILDNNLRLFGRPLYRRQRHPFFYAYVMLTAFLPWSLLLIGRAVDVIRLPALRRGLTIGQVLLWAWTATVVGFFSLSWFKLNTYIYPAAPAICLIASYAWEQALERGDEAASGFRASLVAAGLAMAGIGILLAVFLLNVDLPVPRGALLLPIALLIGGLAFTAHLWRRQWRPPAWGLTLIAPLLCGYAIVIVLGFPLLERTRPSVEIARWMVSATTPDTPVAVYRMSRWQASLRFYTGRPVVALENLDDARRYLTQHPEAVVLATQREVETLKREGLSLRVMYRRDAVIGTDGLALRRQRWGRVLVVTGDDAPAATSVATR